MKRLSFVLLVGSISLSASTAWAAPGLPDQQALARSLARQSAVDAYRRGPVTPTVTSLPSNDRKGNMTVGNSTYVWRGTVKRGWVVVTTKLPNEGYERIEHTRGRIFKSTTITRQTSENVDGKQTKTKMEATSRRTFWLGRIKTKESTEVRSFGGAGDSREKRTNVTITDNQRGRTVVAQATVTKEGVLPMSGHDKGATATISGKHGETPKPTVTDIQPYNHSEYVRNQPKPW